MKALVNFSLIKALSSKRIINIIKISSSFWASKIFRRHFLWGKPYILTIEPTNQCNLKCPQCATGSGKIKRKTNHLSFTIYKKIINELSDSLCYLVLFNQGEPFLHDELIEFIRYAKSKNIYVITSTNGHFLTQNICEQFILAGLDAIIISLDGADEQSYKQYRINGNFNQVIEGIKRLTYLRRSLHKKNPSIFIQFLVMKHNEHQLEQMIHVAKALGVDRLLVKTVQVDNEHEAQAFLPQNENLSRYTFKKNKLQLKKSIHKLCGRLWTSSTILCDGRVVPCCFDKNGDFNLGSIAHDNSFLTIWRSKKYENFRNSVIRRREAIDICTNCTQDQTVYLEKAIGLSHKISHHDFSDGHIG